MTAQAQIILWGIATAFPFVLNNLTKRSADAVGVSAILLMGWCMQRVLWAFYGPPECTHQYPLIDAVIGTAVFACWWSSRQAWKLAIVGILALQCTTHLAYILAAGATVSFEKYIFSNNVLYALQLLLACSPGIGYVVGVLVHHLRHLVGPTSHVGA